MLRKAVSPLVLLVAIAAGQTLERKVLVPDSIAVLGIALRSVCDTTGNKVYYPGIGAVGVLSGELGRRTGRIEVPGGLALSSGLHWDAALDKVCCVWGWDSAIGVIDTRTDSLVARMVFPGDRLAYDGDGSACINTREHKLYAWANGLLAKFDLTTNRFASWVGCTLSCNADMCYNPISNKLYFLSEGNTVAIYDAHADTLLAVVPAGNGATKIGYLERCNKVYVTNPFGGSVSIIDGAGDSLIRELPVPDAPVTLAMNETDGKVYVGCASQGYVIVDGFGDSVRTVVSVPTAFVSGAVWNPRTDRAYLSGAYQVRVVDGRTDSVLGTVNFQAAEAVPTGAVANPVRNIVYFTNVHTSQILAIDGSADTVLWSEYSGRAFYGIPPLWHSRSRRLYNMSQAQQCLTVTNLQPCRTSATVPLPGYRQAQSGGTTNLSPDQNRLYVFDAAESVARVVSCTLDRVVDSFRPGGLARYSWIADSFRRQYTGFADIAGGGVQGLRITSTDDDSTLKVIAPCGAGAFDPGTDYCAYSITSEKLYWPKEDSLLVFDVRQDSLLRSIRLGGLGASALHWVPSSNRVYVSRAQTDFGLQVIDCTSDSVIATVSDFPVVRSMCYAPTNDHLYGLTHQGLTVLDCGQNQITSSIDVPFTYEYVAPVYNPIGNKVFFAASSRIFTQPYPIWSIAGVDCATDQITSWLDVETQPEGLTVDADSGFIYASCSNSAIYVIRDQTPGGVARGPESSHSRASLDIRPNPTRGDFLVSVYLLKSCTASIKVCDITGRVVAKLREGKMGPGQVVASWGGETGQGRASAGVYVVRLDAGTNHLTKKIVLSR